MEQITAKVIQADFRKELVEQDSRTCETLRSIGASIVPPKEYSEVFPLHKIIHVGRIKKLAQKYGLVFGHISQYIGSIPDKNMTELADFLESYPYRHNRWHGNGRRLNGKKFVKGDTIGRVSVRALSFGIVAPQSDMADAIGNVFMDEPIIFAMILEDDQSRFHWAEWGVIVTAWGDEASDPHVINPISN